jgi:acyl-CoA thioester hydrolase
MHEPCRGWRSGDAHFYPLRVYYEDTDAGGIVYHASYLRFAERARNEMLRLAGVAHAAMAAHTGVALAVRRCAIDYRRPARLDDPLLVRTRLIGIGAATLDLCQDVLASGAVSDAGANHAGANEQAALLVRLTLRLAAINAETKPVRLPVALRAALCGIIAESPTENAPQ